MIYVFEDGRILYNSDLLTSDDSGKYVGIESLPTTEKFDGKVGVITGCNLQTGKLIIEYQDIVTIEEQIQIPVKEPSETERIMQAITDAELRDLEIQQNQELLAQQMADIEVALLGGDR